MPALPPKAPPTSRGDHPDVVVGPAQGVGEQVAGHVRVLRGDPGGDLVALVTPVAGLHEDGVALDGRGGDALVDHPGADDVVGRLERVGAVLVVAPGGDVRAETLELQGSVVGYRRLDVGDDGQVVVVDVDQLGRVDGLRAGLRDHQGDRVAHEPHLLVGERPTGALLVDVRERLQAAGPEVLGRVDGQHARGPLGLGRVDRADRGVRERAAHEHRVPDALHPVVVDEGSAAHEQLAVLDPTYLCPQQRSRHVRSLRPDRRHSPRGRWCRPGRPVPRPPAGADRWLTATRRSGLRCWRRRRP